MLKKLCYFGHTDANRRLFTAFVSNLNKMSYMVILGKQMFVDYIVCIWSLIYGICFRLRICVNSYIVVLDLLSCC